MVFIPVDSLRRNFAEVKAGMRPKEAVEESNRGVCIAMTSLALKYALTGINIPSFIKKNSIRQYERVGAHHYGRESGRRHARGFARRRSCVRAHAC